MFGVLRSLYRMRSVAMILAGGLLLSACATVNASGPMTPEQQQLHDSNRRFVTTTVEGVAIGAVGGALIGLLAGGTRGAIIGAGAGAVVGGVGGYLVAQNNYAQTRNEQTYRAAIADAQTQTVAFQRDAALSESIAAQAEREAAQLNAQYRAHSITADQYRAKLAGYRTTLDDIDAKNVAARKELAALQQSAAVTPGSDGAPLRAAAQSIGRDDRRISAAKERLRRVVLQEPSV
jgi:hypothetical protein